MPESNFFCDISESAVAVVVQQHVVTPEGNKQILPAIVVIVTRTDPLPPARQRDPGLLGYVSERAIPIVVIKVAGRFLPLRKTCQSAPVYQEHVRPAVIVIIEKGDAAPSRLDDVFLPLLIAVHGLGRESGTRRDVDEIHFRRSREGTLGSSAFTRLLSEHRSEQQQTIQRERCNRKTYGPFPHKCAFEDTAGSTSSARRSKVA